MEGIGGPVSATGQHVILKKASWPWTVRLQSSFTAFTTLTPDGLVILPINSLQVYIAPRPQDAPMKG